MQIYFEFLFYQLPFDIVGLFYDFLFDIFLKNRQNLPSQKSSLYATRCQKADKSNVDFEKLSVT